MPTLDVPTSQKEPQYKPSEALRKGRHQVFSKTADAGQWRRTLECLLAIRILIGILDFLVE